VEPAEDSRPDRLDFGHREPELVTHGLADRLPPPAGHIHVRSAAAPVGDGERLVGGEVPKRGDRDRHGDRHGEQRIIGVIDTQVQASRQNTATTATPQPYVGAGRPGTARQ